MKRVLPKCVIASGIGFPLILFSAKTCEDKTRQNCQSVILTGSDPCFCWESSTYRRQCAQLQKTNLSAIPFGLYERIINKWLISRVECHIHMQFHKCNRVAPSAEMWNQENSNVARNPEKDFKGHWTVFAQIVQSLVTTSIITGSVLLATDELLGCYSFQ